MTSPLPILEQISAADLRKAIRGTTDAKIDLMLKQTFEQELERRDIEFVDDFLGGYYEDEPTKEDEMFPNGSVCKAVFELLKK